MEIIELNKTLKKLLVKNNLYEGQKIAAKEVVKIFGGIKTAYVLQLLKVIQEDLGHNSIVTPGV